MNLDPILLEEAKRQARRDIANRAATLGTDGRVTPSQAPAATNHGTRGFFDDFGSGEPGTPILVPRSGSPDRLSSVKVLTGASMVYDDQVLLSPMARAAKITATASANAYMEFDAPARIGYMTHGRAYIHLSAAPGANLRPVQWFYKGASRGFIRISTARKIEIGSDTSTVVASSTTVLQTGTFYRLEWDVTRHATAGIVTVRIYQGHDTTPLETIVSSGFNTGTYVNSIQFGSVNNTNLGSCVFHLAAFADLCETPPGIYTGPPPHVFEFTDASGTTRYFAVTHDGEVLGYASAPVLMDSAHFKIRPGDVVFRIDKRGNVILGRSLRTDPNSVGSSAGMYEGYDIVTGRLSGQSLYAMAVNDPPDLTLVRASNINNEFSGTDAVTNGASFGSASMAFQSSDLGREVVVAGTGYYVASIQSPTACTLETADGDPATLTNATGVAWSIPTHPYPHVLAGSGGQVGQIRATPFAFPFIRKGSDGVVNGTTTFTSASAAFTSSDVNRAIMLGGSTARIYTIAAFVNATTVMLDRADAATASGVTWSISGNNLDPATRIAIDIGTMGMELHGNEKPRQWDASGARNYAPVDIYFSMMDDALYGDGAGTLRRLILRYDGRVEVPGRLTFTDPALTNYAVAPTDTQAWREAAGIERHSGLVKATDLGFATRDIDSTGKTDGQIDTLWTAAPPNGTIVTDHTNNLILARQNGTWKKYGAVTPADLTAKADLVGGKVPSGQLPAIATGQTVTVASQAAMLALTATDVQPGDIAIRSDQSGHRWLLADPDPSVLGHWIALEVPAAADAVSSVNGYTGTVVLAKSDLGLGNVDNTADTAKTVAGDVTGTLGSSTVTKLHGKNVPTPGAPENGKSFVYDNASGAMVWTDMATQAELDAHNAIGSGAHGATFAVLTSDVGPISSDTAFHDVTGLALPIGASATEIWLVKLWILLNGANSTHDAQLAFTFPSGLTGRFGPITGTVNSGQPSSGIGWGTVTVGTTPPVLTTNLASGLAFGTTAGVVGIDLVAIIYGGGTAGNLQLRYAQNTSDAGNLSVLKGSCLEARKLAA